MQLGKTLTTFFLLFETLIFVSYAELSKVADRLPEKITIYYVARYSFGLILEKNQLHNIYYHYDSNSNCIYNNNNNNNNNYNNNNNNNNNNIALVIIDRLACLD